MKVSVNTSKLQAQLEALKKQVQGKLEGMVKQFSYNVTKYAIDKTPYGTKGHPLYDIQRRIDFFGADGPGSAKGGWTIGVSTKPHVKNPENADSIQALNTKATAVSTVDGYTLGRTVYITNSVPYVAGEGFTLPWMGSLEAGYSQQAPDGIFGPTWDMITNVFSQNLGNYYKQEFTGEL